MNNLTEYRVKTVQVTSDVSCGLLKCVITLKKLNGVDSKSGESTFYFAAVSEVLVHFIFKSTY